MNQGKIAFIFIILIAIACLLFSCSDLSREKIVDKSELTGRDYRLFQNTPAWELAKAVEDENTKRRAQWQIGNEVFSFGMAKPSAGRCRPTDNAATNANKSPFPFCTITGFSYIYKVMQNKANPVTPRCHQAFHHTESPRPKGALP